MQSLIDHPSNGLQVRSTGAHARPDLTTGQVDALAGILRELLEDHRRRLEENEDLFHALTDDASVGGDERQDARHRAERELDAIHATKAALAAIDEGGYGVCVGCGAPIPYERLEALPRTRTCVACPEPLLSG
jgi:RNA polymerase-binding transcription factor DksA